VTSAPFEPRASERPKCVVDEADEVGCPVTVARRVESFASRDASSASNDWRSLDAAGVVADADVVAEDAPGTIASCGTRFAVKGMSEGNDATRKGLVIPVGFCCVPVGPVDATLPP
jgi:hypothetical protein